MGATITTRPARPRKMVYQGDPLAGPAPEDLLRVLEPHRGRADVLVATLQEVQELYGYLPERAVRYAAREMGIPLARIYGVSTFYNQFRFTPPGRFAIQVCRGTACHVAGSEGLLKTLATTLGLAPDETTPDGLFSLQTVACLGCCSLAPVAVVNRDVHGEVSPARLEEILARYKQTAGEAPS